MFILLAAPSEVVGITLPAVTAFDYQDKKDTRISHFYTFALMWPIVYLLAALK